MTNIKVVVFDLFDTLIHDIRFDFSSGLLYLYENILSNGTEKKEFLNYTNTYWKVLYDKRIDDNTEISFDKELLDLKNKFGFKVDWSIDDIEYNCAIAMNETKLFDDTIPILERLNTLGIPVYLLSNTIFRKNVMKRLLNPYDLEKYFVNTYFSADYSIRKPHLDFFQIVMKEIEEYDKSITREEVLFIGDSYTADVLGAKNFGFTPVFLNRQHIPGVNTEYCLEITSLNGLNHLIN